MMTCARCIFILDVVLQGALAARHRADSFFVEDGSSVESHEEPNSALGAPEYAPHEHKSRLTLLDFGDSSVLQRLGSTSGEAGFPCCCVFKDYKFATRVKALKGWPQRASVYSDSSRSRFVRRIEQGELLDVLPGSPQPWFQDRDPWFQVTDGWVSYHPTYSKVDYYDSGGQEHLYLTYDWHVNRFEVNQTNTIPISKCWSGAHSNNVDKISATEQCADPTAFLVGNMKENMACEEKFSGVGSRHAKTTEELAEIVMAHASSGT